MGKRGRPKGRKSSYTMSAEAYAQRMHAPLKTGVHSRIWKEIIEDEDNTGEWKDLFIKYKLEAWKSLGSPLMFIANEVANMKAYFDMMLHNKKIDPGLFLKYQRTLLEFVKEINKYTQVSADTKVNLLRTMIQEDKELDVPVVKLPKK